MLHARAYLLQSPKNDSGRTLVHGREPEPPAAPRRGPTAFKPAGGHSRPTTRQPRHRSRAAAAACSSVQTLSGFYRRGFSLGSFHSGGGSLHGLRGSGLSRRRAGSIQAKRSRNTVISCREKGLPVRRRPAPMRFHGLSRSRSEKWLEISFRAADYGTP